MIEVTEGSAFTIYALDLATGSQPADCPAMEFIESLSDPSRKSLVNTLLAHAQQGPLRNATRSRGLGNGIFEFKTRQGDRLMFFYYGPRTTILANGFKKGAKLREEMRRAERLRAQLEAEGTDS